MEMKPNDEQPASGRRRRRRAAQAAGGGGSGGGRNRPGEDGKPPPEAIEAGSGGPAAVGDANGYRLVVHRWRGARGPRAAKAAADRAPVGRLRVQKDPRRRTGSRRRDTGTGWCRRWAGLGSATVRHAVSRRGADSFAALRGGGANCANTEV